MKTYRHVAIVGPGRMGNLMALAYAFAGLQAQLVDLRPREPAQDEAKRREAFAMIEAALDFLVAQEVAPAAAKAAVLARIAWTPRAAAENGIGAADIVVEAVAENLEAKRALFAEIGPWLKADVVIGSTTSTIAPDDLASAVPDPARFMNIHWINPAHISPLIELQPHAGTDQQAVEDMRVLHEAMGKIPIVCGPTPGYVMPRLQLALMAEAARMIEEGVATPEDVDRAMRWGLGIRYANMGVVEFIDWGGVEILFHAGNYMARKLGDRFAPPAIVGRMMQEGRSGLRSGQGFYDWRGKDAPAAQRRVQSDIVALLRKHDRLPRLNALQP